MTKTINPAVSSDVFLQWLIDKINPDDPHCVYCQGKCDVAVIEHDNGRTYDTVYTCRECQERCSIAYAYISSIFRIGEKDFHFNFLLTCNEIEIKMAVENKKLDVRLDKCSKQWTEVPLFEVDFSDKEQLMEKLKTYVFWS